MKIRKKCCLAVAIPMDAYIVKETARCEAQTNMKSVYKEAHLIFRAEWQAICPYCGQLVRGEIKKDFETPKSLVPIMEYLADKSLESQERDIERGRSATDEILP